MDRMRFNIILIQHNLSYCITVLQSSLSDRIKLSGELLSLYRSMLFKSIVLTFSQESLGSMKMGCETKYGEEPWYSQTLTINLNTPMLGNYEKVVNFTKWQFQYLGRTLNNLSLTEMVENYSPKQTKTEFKYSWQVQYRPQASIYIGRGSGCRNCASMNISTC